MTRELITQDLKDKIHKAMKVNEGNLEHSFDAVLEVLAQNIGSVDIGESVFQKLVYMLLLNSEDLKIVIRPTIERPEDYVLNQSKDLKSGSIEVYLTEKEVVDEKESASTAKVAEGADQT